MNVVMALELYDQKKAEGYGMRDVTVAVIDTGWIPLTLSFRAHSGSMRTRSPAMA